MAKTVNTGYMIFLAVVSAIGGILFGYDTAVISGTIGIVTQQFSLDTMQQGWYVGCALIGSIAGASFAGMTSDAIGRKKTMLIAAVFFCICAIGCAESTSFAQLVAFRIIGGVGVGFVSIVSPIYISEISVAEKRGTLVSLYQLAVTIGFLIAYLVNYAILDISQTREFQSGFLNRMLVDDYWRGMLGSGAVPAVLFLAIIFFIPESPKWLITKGRGSMARTVLGRIYPDAARLESEYEITKSSLNDEVKSEWKELLQPWILKAVLIGSAIAILGQFMGVNAVLYYGPEIFAKAGIAGGDALFSQVLVGIVNMVTTVIALLIIDKVGRKQLVYWGVSGMIVSLVMIGIYFAFGERIGLGNGFMLAFFLFYVFCCAISISSEQRQGKGHVRIRFRPVGRHLSHRPAHTLAAGESDSCRYILPVRRNVHTLHTDHVESRTGDHREDT